MISEAEREELREAGLARWHATRAANGSLRQRVADAVTHASTEIDRAGRAIERALREVEVSRTRRTIPNRPTVVVADSRIAERVLLEHALRMDRRVEVVGDAVDGTEALATAIVRQPDAIVLDDRLPTLPGLDVAADLRMYAPRTRSILLVDDRDPLFFSRPSVVDAVAPRYGNRHSLVELVARVVS